jgi:putative flippase GtrA
MTSISAFLLAFGISLALKYIFSVDVYIATPVGTICAFLYNFMISKRFVFRPAPEQSYESLASSTNISTPSASNK